MTTVTARRVDRITAQAQQVRLGNALLTAIAAVLWALGWITGKILVTIWLAIVWSATAIAVGWKEATTRPEAPEQPPYRQPL